MAWKNQYFKTGASLIALLIFMKASRASNAIPFYKILTIGFTISAKFDMNLMTKLICPKNDWIAFTILEIGILSMASIC